MFIDHPVGREVLLPPAAPTPVPTLNIYSLAQLQKTDLTIDDNNIEVETFLTPDPQPTYTGEAHISSKLLDAGIEIPTRIYSSAEEAVNLENFPPEVRPYIKEIFLEKYPSCVSLHALDAGDLSKTLGYVHLNLRSNETLPRAKRLYHISPSDSQHLSDLLDFLVKQNFIQRSPVHTDGQHLYGLASYLVPRQKAGCLGRLIVDFSPINSLLETPPPHYPGYR
jgi:hypothetical protein